MKVGVWMPLYDRPLVLRAALESLKAMRIRWRNMGIDLELCVGWSLPDDLTQVVNHSAIRTLLYLPRMTL